MGAGGRLFVSSLFQQFGCVCVAFLRVEFISFVLGARATLSVDLSVFNCVFRSRSLFDILLPHHCVRCMRVRECVCVCVFVFRVCVSLFVCENVKECRARKRS